MTKRNGREELRGAEVETFDLIAEVVTSLQWAELLKAPLERAVGQGNRALAQKLVRAGAEIGDALHVAARGGHGGVFSDLLDNGAPLAAKDAAGMTPLHLAARNGEAEMVQLSLVKGADKDVLDNENITPLFLAVCNSHSASTSALLNAGADVDVQWHGLNMSVVHQTDDWGHVKTSRVKIEHGVDVNVSDLYCGTTLLHKAALRSQTEVIGVLIEAGADIEARDRDGDTPLHLAADNSVEAVLAVVKHGATIDVRDSYDETPLHRAASQAGKPGTSEMVDLLLRSGADETITNFEGQTAVGVVGERFEIYAHRFDEQETPLVEDVERVRQLLANAPIDRAWRRRGYLVLCRAHPGRIQLERESSSGHVREKRGTSSGARLARADSSGSDTAGGDRIAGDQTGGVCANVVVRVLGVEEDGMFRTIVGYL